MGHPCRHQDHRPALRRYATRYAILLVPLLALLVACGGGDEGQPTPSPSPAAARPSPTPKAKATPTPTPSPSQAPAPAKVFFKRGSELWSINLDGSDPLLLTNEVLSGYSGAGGNSSPRPSPQRDKIAFIGSDGNLWVVDSLGRDRAKLSDEAFPGDEAYYQTDVLISGWSPDGDSILYSVESLIGLGGDQQERVESLGFYVVDPTTGEKSKVPNLANFVAWSPDPNSLVFERQDSAGSSRDWFNLNLKTEMETRVTASPFICFSVQPSLPLSPNRLLYSCGNLPEPGSSTIVIANIDNTGQQVLLQGQWADLQRPLLSPTGDGFVYRHHLRQPDGSYYVEIQFFSLQTGQQTLLVSGCVEAREWVDERSLAILESETCNFGGPATLYLVDVTSGAKTKLVDDVAFE